MPIRGSGKGRMKYIHIHSWNISLMHPSESTSFSLFRVTETEGQPHFRFGVEIMDKILEDAKFFIHH